MTIHSKKHLSTIQIAKIRAIYEEHNCAYCGYLTNAVSWWCTNDKAIKARGTAIPGVIHCPYWIPDKQYIRAKINKLP